MNPQQRETSGTMTDRRLSQLILLAVIFSVGHHIDHIIRGNHVGWPLIAEVNAFTYSLAIYPVLLAGWLLYRTGMVGPGFWLFLSGGGTLFIAAIHFGPTAVEPPADIITLYQPRLIGWIAFAWLLGFVAVLAAASLHEWKLWKGNRQEAALRSQQIGKA